MTEPIAEEIKSRPIPEIKGEEDAPFPNGKEERGTSRRVDEKLDAKDDLSKEITRFRYLTGRKVLYISMAAMGVAVIIDLIAEACGIKNELVSSAFEAFKLITMTVLGYIFGSDNSR